jgi:hypothetical protein
MAPEQIDRARWAPFFDTVTKSLTGKQAEIEVASLDLGDQIEAEWTPLIGITYDKKDDLIEIQVEKLDHLIRSPRAVFVEYEVSGIVAIAIDDADGNRQIVRLKDALSLPAPAVAASGEAAQ